MTFVHGAIFKDYDHYMRSNGRTYDIAEETFCYNTNYAGDKRKLNKKQKDALAKGKVVVLWTQTSFGQPTA